MSRILVTGVAGFIGSHLAERLLDLSHEVIGLDSFTTYYARERKLRNIAPLAERTGFRLIEADLLEIEGWTALDGVDNVVHLAAEPGVRASWGSNFSVYLRRNVEATQRLLEQVAQAGVGRFVLASSSSVYGSADGRPATEDTQRRPASPYAISKLAAEELVSLYVREYGLAATALRYFTVYGPRQRPEMALSRFISAALDGEPLQVFGDGTQEREMTFVSDVVEATVSALEGAARSGVYDVYNIGGGARATVNELVDSVEQALDTNVEVRYLPAARGDARSTWADCSRAGRDLGYEPRVGLEAGVAAQVDWTLRPGSRSSTVDSA